MLCDRTVTLDVFKRVRKIGKSDC